MEINKIAGQIFSIFIVVVLMACGGRSVERMHLNKKEYLLNPSKKTLNTQSSLKEILIELSNQGLRSEGLYFSTEQKKNKWIGELPVRLAEIHNIEVKLKIKLPEDVKEFYLISNGFPSIMLIDPSFCPIQRISYLKDVDPQLIEIWEEMGNTEDAEKLKRAIKIGGFNEEQYFFLIPPSNTELDWEYWVFANWIPGKEVHSDLKTYFLALHEQSKLLNQLKQ